MAGFIKAVKREENSIRLSQGMANNAGKGGKRKRAGVALIPDRVDIADRPQIVNQRKRIGDWEGDTVYGQKTSMSFLRNHTQVGREEQMKILMADSGGSGPKNLTPRKVLKGLTPLEVFTGKRVALIT